MDYKQWLRSLSVEDLKYLLLKIQSTYPVLLKSKF